MGLNLSDIREDHIRVFGKGSKERVIYINDACADAINQYLAVRKSISAIDKNALFLSNRRTRMSREAVHSMVKNSLRRAGLDAEKYSSHKLRHTAATLMGMAVAWMVMHNPLVLVGSAIGVVVTHWETLEKFIDNPAFQVVATVLAGIASGFIILKAPLVAVAGILATIITHWEDIKRWADKAKTAFATSTTANRVAN